MRAGSHQLVSVGHGAKHPSSPGHKPNGSQDQHGATPDYGDLIIEADGFSVHRTRFAAFVEAYRQVTTDRDRTADRLERIIRAQKPPPWNSSRS